MLKQLGSLFIVMIFTLLIGIPCGIGLSHHTSHPKLLSTVRISKTYPGDLSANLINLSYSTKKVKAVTDQPDVMSLTKEFKMRMIQKTNDHFVVLNYKTKEELVDSLTGIVERPLAQTFVNHFYTEKNGQLKIIPTEFIPWFDSSKPYTLKKVAKNSYQLEQKNKTSLHGSYRLEIVFRKTKSSWRISSVTINGYTL